MTMECKIRLGVPHWSQWADDCFANMNKGYAKQGPEYLMGEVWCKTFILGPRHQPASREVSWHPQYSYTIDRFAA